MNRHLSGDVPERDRRICSVDASSPRQIAAIRRYRKRMGWDVPWYTTLDEFAADFDVPEYWGVNVFLRDGDQIYRSYFASGRAAEDPDGIIIGLVEELR